MAILRLTQDLAWIEEVLNAGKGIKGLNDIELRKSGTPFGGPGPCFQNITF